MPTPADSGLPVELGNAGSTGRTVSVLVTQAGEFRIDFSTDVTFPPGRTASVALRKGGDCVIWGPGIYHRAFAIHRAAILSVRWELDESEMAARANTNTGLCA